MQGVILSGGRGTRLGPLTAATNKHLLAVYDRPMIVRAIDQLVRAGIDDVIVVTGVEHAPAFRQLFDVLGGVGVSRLRIATQPAPAGLADALARAETLVDSDRLCVVLGDNVVAEGVIEPSRAAFEHQRAGARVIVAPVDAPERFGIARFASAGDPTSRVVRIEEKPISPVAGVPHAVLGVYFYPGDVFDRCRALVPSARGELEITDLNNAYAGNEALEHDVTDGAWVDAGTPEDLWRAGELVRAEVEREAGVTGVLR
ncbi:MAG: sugar phosphate nucleotidyltransferase [Planctomycetota bacterium]